MRRRTLTRLSILATCLGLFACSGASSPGGAAGPEGGPVGGGGPLDGAISAAQPMDSGFSGPKKDIENIHYLLRDGRAVVLCQYGDGKVRARIEGYLESQKPSGEVYSATGFVRVNDLAAGRYLVTKASMEADKFGFISPAFKVQTPLQLTFELKQNYEGPLDTLLSAEAPSEGLRVIIPIEPKPALVVENGPNASAFCVEKAKDFELSDGPVGGDGVSLQNAD